MSEVNDSSDELSALDEVGEAFGKDDDPFKQFDEGFKELTIDPFAKYKQFRIEDRNLTRPVKRRRKRVIDGWIEYMGRFDRHPACPNVQHVMGYIDSEISKDIGTDWVNAKLRILSNMFEYWAEHPKMPHGTGEAVGFNPFTTAKKLKEDEIKAKTASKKKPPHPISIEEIGRRIRSIKHILNRSVVATQFKYGSRAGQVANLQIQDLKISNSDLQNQYPELGSHPMIDGISDDAIYFAPRSERSGGKSQRPIVMPIDEELRHLLTRYLRQRPPVNRPWLFVNFSTGKRLRTQHISDRMWKPAFHPAYDETEDYDSVTSHYARHRFGTYWKKEIDANVELIKYMRGDIERDVDEDDLGALQNYVHTYYSDIKNLYLSDIYRFNLY